MLGSIIAYAGLVAALGGGVSLLKPLRFLRIRTRRAGVVVLAAGVAVVMIGMLLPSSMQRIAAPQTRLDEFAPQFQFNEFHHIPVNAPAAAVDKAIREVTADEIWLFRTLTGIRRGGREMPQSILNPSKAPILDVATRSGFLLLADEPGREIVIGAVVMAPPGTKRPESFGPQDYQALERVGFAKATMNFRIEPQPGEGSVTVTTETRVYATDEASARRFARYWRVIYPGSALLRRTWLRAIQKRAEAGGEAARP